MSFCATYFGSSGWLVEFGNLRVLIDPWLTGTLTFPPGSWLIEGQLSNEINIPEKLDLLLLTQGLADHAHPATLKKLPKSLHVVGSKSAAKVVKQLGFESVQELEPGKTAQIDQLMIEATKGAPVPGFENGYILSHPIGSLYLEPHGFLDEDLKSRQLDAVITPVVDVKIPLAGAFLKGKSILPEIMHRFDPLTILASTTGGDATFTGILGKLMTIEGSVEEAANNIDEGKDLINPIPGEKYLLKTYKSRLI